MLALSSLSCVRRKVSLGAKDAIDATAHGQSESKAARQHLLALSRAPLRLGSKRTEQEMCWISVLEGTMVLRKRRYWGKGSLVLAHRVLSMSQDFCVNKVFQGGGDYVATLRRFHSHDYSFDRKDLILPTLSPTTSMYPS